MRIPATLAVLAAGLAVAPDRAAAQEAVPALPGGASSLQETYRDWRVACSVETEARRCALSQQQTEQNGRRVLAVELAPGAEGTLSGTLVLPFGLLLDAGVGLEIDDRPMDGTLRFSTCLPAGCVVPLAFDAAAISALRAGAVLKLNTTISENGRPLAFTVPLGGFSAALDRTAALLQ